MQLSNELTYLYPEWMLVLTGIVVLLSRVFTANGISENFARGLTLLGLLVAFTLVLPMSTSTPMSLFSGHFVVDNLSHILKAFMLVLFGGVVLYSKSYIKVCEMPVHEYWALSLFSLSGMFILVSAHSLLTLYLGIELLTIPLYAMVALRRDSLNSSEAAIKYFVMGSVASGIFLFGLSLLFGLTGTIYIKELVVEMNNVMVSSQSPALMMNFALVCTIVGLGFKLAVAPYHLWAPDVYDGAPTSVTLLLSTVPKLAAFGMVFRLLVEGLSHPELYWSDILMVLSVLSIIIGNLYAMAQTRIKRLLAYSAVSHMGYMLLGFIAQTNFGYMSALFYMMVYAFMSLAAFGVLVLLSNQYQELENINDLKGLNQRSPWLAFMFMMIFFSLAGIPPFLGFWAKLMVLKAIVDVNMIGLAIFAAAFALLGTFYYIRIIKTIYFEAPDDYSEVSLPKGSQALVSVNVVLLLIFGLFPQVLLQMSQNAMIGHF